MTKLLDSTLVLCDLDHLLLAGDGNMLRFAQLRLFESLAADDDIDSVGIAGEPAHLQRERIKYLSAPGMGIGRGTGERAAESGVIVFAYHVHGRSRPFR